MRGRPGLIHHSDHGVQYASTAYVERLLNVQSKTSKPAVGNPYDNAKAESLGYVPPIEFEMAYAEGIRC